MPSSSDIRRRCSAFAWRGRDVSSPAQDNDRVRAIAASCTTSLDPQLSLPGAFQCCSLGAVPGQPIPAVIRLLGYPSSICAILEYAKTSAREEHLQCNAHKACSSAVYQASARKSLAFTAPAIGTRAFAATTPSRTLSQISPSAPEDIKAWHALVCFFTWLMVRAEARHLATETAEGLQDKPR